MAPRSRSRRKFLRLRIIEEFLFAGPNSNRKWDLIIFGIEMCNCVVRVSVPSWNVRVEPHTDHEAWMQFSISRSSESVINRPPGSGSLLLNYGSGKKVLFFFYKFRGTQAWNFFNYFFCRNRNHMVPRACKTRFLKIIFKLAEIFDF